MGFSETIPRWHIDASIPLSSQFGTKSKATVGKLPWLFRFEVHFLKDSGESVLHFVPSSLGSSSSFSSAAHRDKRRESNVSRLKPRLTSATGETRATSFLALDVHSLLRENCFYGE
jgi:hypothetical protein